MDLALRLILWDRPRLSGKAPATGAGKVNTEQEGGRVKARKSIAPIVAMMIFTFLLQCANNAGAAGGRLRHRGVIP